MSAISEIKCEDIQSIKDFHQKLGEWNDYHGGGKGDSSKVSCKQVGKKYDELLDKYNKYYKGHYTEKQVAQAMCKCCKEKKQMEPTTMAEMVFDDEWERFYKCMGRHGIYKNGKSPKLPL